MIVNVVHSRPKPGFKQLFVQKMRAYSDEVRREPGCLRYDFFVDPDADHLLLYEEWESRASFDAHAATPRLAEHHAQVRDWFEGPVQMSTFAVADVERVTL